MPDMEVTPQSVASATFRVGRKGFDPDEVRAYLATVARALSDAHDRANHMETRARQAVARIQEMQAATAPRVAEGSKLDDTATISRTLLLAQKTADETIEAARLEADQFRLSARAEAEGIVAQAHADAAQVVEGARLDARQVADAEQLRAEAELQQLLIRLEFLRDDVNQMEEFTIIQRNRLLDAAATLRETAERPVGGLGEIRTPTLRGATPDTSEPSGIYGSLHQTWPEPPPPGSGRALVDPADGIAAVDDADEGVEEIDDGGRDDLGDGVYEIPELRGSSDDATLAMPVLNLPDAVASGPATVAEVDAVADLALEAVPDAEGLSFADEITAEVPIFQRPQQAPPSPGMRILDE